ncbi:Peptidase M16 inactive domain protein [compost metagenome]
MIPTKKSKGLGFAGMLLAATMLLQPATMTQALAAPAKAAQPQAAKPQAATSQAHVLKALPKPQEFRLANGLKVLLVERHDLPLVQVQVVFRAGRLYEPAGKAGVADLTANLMTKGTASRSATEIAHAIDFVGGSLAVGSDTDMAVASLAILKKDLPVGLELLGDVLTQPAFSAEELDRAREQAIARLRSSLDDADAVLGAAYDRAIFGQYPYGRTNLGTDASLSALTREDIVAYHQARYRPDGAFAVIVGDVTRSEVESRFGQALADWKGQVSDSAIPQLPAPIKGKHVTLVDMDVNQSYVMLGNQSFKRNDPDYYATSLMLSILGGGMNSRLFSEVRDRQGLAYGVWSSNRMDLTSGTVMVGLQTKTASTKQALNSIQHEIARMAKDGVTAKELADAKSAMLGFFPMQLESNPDLARMLTRIEFYGLGSDYLSRFAERVSAVDQAAIRRMAQKYLPSGDYALVLVAPAKQIEADLKGFGSVKTLSKQELIR